MFLAVGTWAAGALRRKPCGIKSAFSRYLTNVFEPNLDVGTLFQLLETLVPVCGLKVYPALVLGQRHRNMLLATTLLGAVKPI